METEPNLVDIIPREISTAKLTLMWHLIGFRMFLEIGHKYGPTYKMGNDHYINK
jgi:hypothetical protein